jgi:hypothetical protein
MTRGLYPKTALAIACVGLGLALAACSSADSGQTGSPNHDPTDYESPTPVTPMGGGSESNGDGGGRPVVAQPVPTPSPAAVVESTLLVGGERLSLLEVSTAAEPELVGRLETGGHTQILSASALDRVVLLVAGAPSYSGETLPEAPLPWREQRIVELDASDPSAPEVVSTFAAPAETQAVVDLGAGYALVGGRYGASGRACGDVTEIEQPPPPLESTWLRRYSNEGEVGAERSFGPSLFVVSNDRTHVVRVATDPEGAIGEDAELELIELTTLETVLSTSVDGRDFDGAFGADHAGGQLLLAGGNRVFGWDVASGSALEPLATPSPVGAVRFLPGGELAALSGGGNGLVRLDGDGALELVAVPEGGTVLEASDALQPFGDGFVALGGVGLASSPRVVAKRYVLDESGALAFVDELVTDWYYWAARTFRVDPSTGRISYVLPVDDTDRGNVGVIALVDGALQASSLTEMAVFDPAPIPLPNGLIATTAHAIQSIEFELGATSPSLAPGDVVVTGLESVRDQLEHAGVLFTLHRTDTGRTSVRYRADEYATATNIELSHAANALVPVDATHLVVLGLTFSGQCEELIEEYGNDFSECSIDKRNGASVLTIDGSAVTLSSSVELTNDLLPATAEGAEQWLDWSGFLSFENGSLALLGSRTEVCTTEATCAAIGAVAYSATGGGSPGSCGSATCEPEPEPEPEPPPEVYGSVRQSLLLPVAVGPNSEAKLGAPVLGGARNDLSEVYEYNVAHALLEYAGENGPVRAYNVREPIYDAEGNGVADSHGQGLARHYVQFIESNADEASFGEKVNVPGEAVMLEGAAYTREGRGRAVFTLEPAYRADDSPTTRLHRLRIEDGVAHLEESVDVGPYVAALRTADGELALLSLPGDYCASDARYELRVAKLDPGGIALSDPLVLQRGEGWGFRLTTYPPESAESGKVHLFGGPAANGRLIVDSTTNPPSIAAYETR